MMSDNLTPWFPDHPAIYDIHKTYKENADFGPFFDAEIPKRKWAPENTWKKFLGHSIASPLGIPAGPLLNARWIKLAAELGYDVLTYKTIRSAAHPAHPLPNMIFIETHGMLSPEDSTKPVSSVPTPSPDIEDLAVTNSFGMPSMSPEFLMEDIAKANSYLKEGQVMIVSVVGSVRQEISFLEDFVQAALLAKEAGAKIIEANFSCPNVDKKAGCLYMSPQTVLEIGTAIAKAIHPIPLVIKAGLFSSAALMKEVMIAAAKAGIKGFCGINTISRAVVDANGKPILGDSRLTSGICGGPIRKAAVEFIRDASAINKQEKLGLTIMGVGGITLPEHFTEFLEAGAEVAMTATGMMWDPYLAARYHQTHA